ncbi:MAG: ABC transporter permease [Haloechinothrix sp.]
MTAATAPAPVRSRNRSMLDTMVSRRWPVTLVFGVFLLAAWEIGTATKVLPDAVLGPSTIAGAVAEFVASGELPGLLGPSLQRSFAGYVIGAGLGAFVGLLAGTVKAVEDSIELPVSFTYPLPKIALFPVFAVWLGFTDLTRVLVIALACFYPVYLNALSGTRAIDPNLIWVARNAGASKVRTFLQVVVPAALPRTFTGLQISLAISFILLFATETIGFSNGLAADLFQSFQDGRLDRMYAGIAILAIVGFLANAALVGITKRLIRGTTIGGAQHG